MIIYTVSQLSVSIVTFHMHYPKILTNQPHSNSVAQCHKLRFVKGFIFQPSVVVLCMTIVRVYIYNSMFVSIRVKIADLLYIAISSDHTDTSLITF